MVMHSKLPPYPHAVTDKDAHPVFVFNVCNDNNWPQGGPVVHWSELNKRLELFFFNYQVKDY